jgi:heat shock protein HtpX
MRMVLSLLLLLVATGVFIGAVWGVFLGLFVFFQVPVSIARVFALIPTAMILFRIANIEYRGPATIERAATATPVTADEYPELHATVNRVASLFGIPTPTVAISDSPAPEAMVVGVRPSATRLILSTGTLEALDEDELEAVIAHELAHVKNRDATVMTLISVPTVLAAGLVSRFPEAAERDLITALVLAIVGLVGAMITQGIVAVCSRTRELAADRAAVEVIGSAGPLASALRTLDRQIEATPSEDLRSVHSVSSLSILPLESDDEEPLTYWEEVDDEPDHWSVRKLPTQRRTESPAAYLREGFFRTHPPTEKRIRLISDDGQ